MLTEGIDRLKAIDLGSDEAAAELGKMVEGLETLVRQAREPFVLAVVGPVNAGKSSLVNALLGEDLAMVGATETTATVTWFRYGRPDPERPVRCRWRGRRGFESHPKSFLDGLQGDDEEALRRGNDLETIEFLLGAEWLRTLDLVDTPGLGAVSDEHQNRTAEFARLHALLRDRHHQESRHLAQEADAVLYVLAPVAHAGDRAFLQEFQRLAAPGSSSFNAVAVVGKHDDVESRSERGRKLSNDLAHYVNRVVPVSTGVDRLTKRLRADPDLFHDFVRFVRETPKGDFDLMVDSHERFKTFSSPPLPCERRIELQGDVPWKSFRQSALFLARRPLEGPSLVLDRLEELAGLAELRGVIERTFVARGPTLRCLRIAQNAERILSEGGFAAREACRAADKADLAMGVRFRAVLKRLQPAALPQDAATLDELFEFLHRHCDAPSRANKARRAFDELAARFARLRRSLESSGEDAQARELLASHRDLLTPEEFEELNALFGRDDTEVDARPGGVPEPSERSRVGQFVWQQRYLEAPDGPLKEIALAARKRYEEHLYALRETSAL